MVKDGLRWRTWVEKVNERRSPRGRRGHLSARDRPPEDLFLKEFDKLEFDKDFDTRFTHARPPEAGRFRTAVYRRRPVGECRRPLPLRSFLEELPKKIEEISLETW